MNYAEFQACSFKEKSPFHRTQFDFFTNLVKWFAMRAAYVLFKMGATANLVDVVGMFIALAGFTLMLRAKDGDVVLPLVGIAIIYFHTFVDFLDGAIAKATKSCSKIGHYLDNLGCDVDRIAFLVIIGVFTNSMYFIVINAFTGAIMILFLPLAREEMPEGGAIGVLSRLYFNKYSFLSVRFMLMVLPMIFAIVIWQGAYLVEVSYIVSLIYAAATALWLIISVPEYKKIREESKGTSDVAEAQKVST